MATVANGIFLLFTVIIAVLLVRRISKSIQEKEEHKIELQKTIIQSQEAEREAIANNLHDDFGPQLSLLSRKLQHVHSDHETAVIPTNDLKEIQEQLSSIHHDLRKYSHDIFPTQIKKIGFIASVQQNLQTMQSSLTTVFENYAPENLTFDTATELTLYRIVNELLNNILKHSEATQLDCELSVENNQFCIVFTYNGKVFTQTDFMHQAQIGQGKGCSSILNRTLQLNGNLTFGIAYETLMQIKLTTPIMC